MFTLVDVALPYSRGTATNYSDRFHDFSVTIVTGMSMATVSVLEQLESGIFYLWNAFF